MTVSCDAEHQTETIFNFDDMRWYCIPFSRCVVTDNSAYSSTPPVSYTDFAEICVQIGQPIFRSALEIRRNNADLGLVSKSCEIDPTFFPVVEQPEDGGGAEVAEDGDEEREEEKEEEKEEEEEEEEEEKEEKEEAAATTWP